jgi:hypothetical protein
MKVNFMIIGAMKCGTTTLCHILSEHPQISFYVGKEAHFFSKKLIYPKSLQEYHNNFRKIDNCIYGEGSTSYTFYPHVNHSICDDLYKYNSDLKFIYIIRNPFERIISHYMHIYERGYTSLSLEESIMKLPILVDYGRYAYQINRYINKFGKEKIMILTFDDLLYNRFDLLKDVSRFLNVDFDGFVNFEDLWLNKSIDGEFRRDYRYDKAYPYWKALGKFFPTALRMKIWDAISLNKNKKFKIKPSLTKNSIQYLSKIYLKDLKELERITGKNLINYWKIPSLTN